MVPPSTGSIDFAPPLRLPWDDYDPPGYESPPIRTWYPPPPPSSDSDNGWVLAVLLVFVFVVCMIGVVLKVYRSKQAHTEAAAEAAAAAAARTRELPWPRQLPGLESLWQHDEVQLPRTRATNPGARATNPTARLPAFTHNRSVKHNVTGGGEEVATCSVCLGVFQLGETVRLLPACMHLYHVECIDPWLDAHSTCPICRSDADPTMNDARPPPV
ncbi:RING-H2 finger protein ATL46-like [Triticum aestivum]|nr:RING-H2 finger protein ATL46-like [Triticum aestivum]